MAISESVDYSDGVTAMKEKSRIRIHPSHTLMIVMVGEEKVITLTVDEKDIVLNADGELDCPFETTIRRNLITVEDIQEWRVEKIQLVQKTKNQETLILEFDAETVLDLLIA